LQHHTHTPYTHTPRRINLDASPCSISEFAPLPKSFPPDEKPAT
jgi:hypothetical protein